MEFTLLDTEEVAGRRAYTLRGEVPAAQEEPFVREATLWVDTETWHVLRLDTISLRNGEEVTGSTVTQEIEYDPEFAADLFTFEPPADAQQLDPS